MLKRWRAMDKALGDVDGLHIDSFARRYKVTTRTVKRDIAAFRSLGQSMEFERDEDRRYRWHYAEDVEWLFLANLPRRHHHADLPFGSEITRHG